MSHTGQNPLAHEPSKTCKDCEHEGKWLNMVKTWIHKNPTEHEKTCSCKKFEAEDDSAGRKIKRLMNDLESGKLKPQKKGCGKIIEVLNEPDIKIVCGRDYYGTNFNGKWINKELALHPSCSGNHTRKREDDAGKRELPSEKSEGKKND
ncbi:hypothetical protein LCGC14_2915370 [marine sediment metagenome]|uniref:Uncharacterized protein n=1 Tax=marine sediment metagenome TaxID=412755 RepID=A0A0F8XQN7_9ZZZZ